jgi:hypothetical protein
MRLRRDLVVKIHPATHAYMCRKFAARAAEARDFEAVVGCDPTEVEGDQYRSLTMPEVIAQGREGFRGRKALDAALAARARGAQHGRSPRREPHGSHTRTRRPGGRRVRVHSGTHGDPSRSSDDDPEPELEVVPLPVFRRAVAAWRAGR